MTDPTTPAAAPITTWRITGIERGDLGQSLRSLNIELTVDTTSSLVVAVIEHALRRAGVTLRLEGDA